MTRRVAKSSPRSQSMIPKPGSQVIPKSSATDTGALGEELVARWLQDRGGEILQRRWRCRWGELDLIVGHRGIGLHSTSAHLTQECHATDLLSVAFVEVKTRSQGNWDENGALAIQARKQAKLWKSAQLFLAAHPDLAELPCQFDVALVTCERLAGSVDLTGVDGRTVAIAAGHRLTLQTYIPAAFTG